MLDSHRTRPIAPRKEPRLAERDAAYQRLRISMRWGVLAIVCLTMLGPTHAQDTIRIPETVGSQSLELDLGVAHPDDPSGFVAAIEVDAGETKSLLKAVDLEESYLFFILFSNKIKV